MAKEKIKNWFIIKESGALYLRLLTFKEKESAVLGSQLSWPEEAPSGGESYMKYISNKSAY